jgi:predicted transcriptional regulator
MLVPIRNNFAKLLEERSRREGRFIPLAEVANEAKVARKTLYKWERNEVEEFSGDVVEKLVNYFGVEISDLLEVVPSNPATNKKASRK